MRKCTPLVPDSRSAERILWSDTMRRVVRQWHCQPSRRLLIALLSLALISLALLKLPLFHTDPKPVEVPVDPVYKQVLLHVYDVRGFSADVGNRTSIRMSYPEGSPKVWEDTDSDLRFVAVIYKSVDFHWLRAMITKTSVSLWNWLFFWQNVPVSVPLKASQFRLLNPEIIRETALDLLHYPNVRERLWGWDQNVPTLGVSALNLATYLCDEVSLAGFGYNLSQKDAPLHYYDHRLMTSMLKEAMHDVQTETTFLKRLVSSGSITDLTGGIHCNFCSR
ncbi:lactosylceramide alpha-2,3-sialyltransferase-like [Sinocyclocheilus rhinocerous]|uniref:lactosylceramide alpha-2,3-sialyltransferase-like n=1 Tax=Sinocyclocheilus rhinocerous TaxID=307959 RepID=UPI0007BA58C9|nr:PREDICTED: lactosylceramide alpha-2,3-sialyltransferase-like [Sinocyclocheilus rhinocerous]